jgi:hypothetical protein
MGTLTQPGTAVNSFYFAYLGQLADEENTHVFRVGRFSAPNVSNQPHPTIRMR